ncbi:hypothetical protein [Anoxybacillus gonensis]|uniref:hypothetical protein n=1 Tax=Anoxybacillus gonensis TaxID=198467 RepID=UPI0002BE8A10|nr:hypothetical protein [Anoxybacillus gonensis]EMI09558.1 PQQ enzyme repeat-containing protein [Anoxybacillus gonensis]
MFKKNTLFLFFTALIILFSTTSSLSFAAGIKEGWKVPVNGKYAFFALPQADGSLVYIDGTEQSYGTLTVVYHIDIMNISQKGTVNKTWGLEAEQIFVGQAGKKQYVVSVKNEKGVVAAYDLNGKKLWEHKVGAAITWIDQYKDTTYLKTKNTMIMLDSKGKRIGSLKITNYPVIGPDGCIYITNYPDSPYITSDSKGKQVTLLKYNKLGKLQWKVNIPPMKNQKGWDIQYHTYNEIYVDKKYVYVNISYTLSQTNPSYVSKTVKMINAIDSKGKIAWSVKSNQEADSSFSLSIAVKDYKNGSLSFEGNTVYFIDKKGKKSKYFETKNGYVEFVNDGYMLLRNNQSVTLMSLELKRKWTVKYPQEAYLDFIGKSIVIFTSYPSYESEDPYGLYSKSFYLFENGKQIGLYKPTTQIRIVAIDEKTRTIYVKHNKTNLLQVLKY